MYLRSRLRCAPTVPADPHLSSFPRALKKERPPSAPRGTLGFKARHSHPAPALQNAGAKQQQGPLHWNLGTGDPPPLSEEEPRCLPPFLTRTFLPLSSQERRSPAASKRLQCQLCPFYLWTREGPPPLGGLGLLEIPAEVRADSAGWHPPLVLHRRFRRRSSSSNSDGRGER